MTFILFWSSFSFGFLISAILQTVFYSLEALSFYYRLDGSWCFFLSKFTILWLSQYHVFFFTQHPVYLYVQLDFGKNGGLFQSWKKIHENFIWKMLLTLLMRISMVPFSGKLSMVIFKEKNHRKIGGVLKIWKLSGKNSMLGWLGLYQFYW